MLSFFWVGPKMLRKTLVVEVDHSQIVVRVTGTSYTASYCRVEGSSDLIARKVPLRDDRIEFIKSSWQLAKGQGAAAQVD